MHRIVGIATASLLLVLVTLVPACAETGLATVSKEADRLFAFAASLMEEKDYYRAITEYKRFVSYFPDDHRPGDKRAAVVFFFGGGWRGGSPGQFQHHCEYLASRGMVAMTADYRVLSRHKTKADKCAADAKSAVRWIRANAERLGVDPNRIAAGGGSAGGHVATGKRPLPP